MQFTEQIISKEDFEKLNRFRMIDELEKNAGVNERYKNCPNCSFGLFINYDAEEFYCENCDKTICPDCEEPPHPKLTCDQYL